VILRRFAQALKEQNWAAIAIEFVLLVLGVFLGIQVANWNQARADRAEYEAALQRLGAEIDTNLASLESEAAHIEQSLAIGGRALTVLQSCVDNEDNVRVVQAGLDEIRGTDGLHPRRNALDEMTSNPRLLAQQSPQERQRFSDLLYYFDVLQTTADTAERRPQESLWELNPLVRVGAPSDSKTTYFGFDWVSTRRRLELGVPLSEACHDDGLVKAFFNWERIQLGLPVIARKWREELLATRQLIEARR
jgi:hypothetical protein